MIHVNNVNSAIESFVTLYRIFLFLKVYFLIWQSYYKLSYEFYKKQFGKMWPKSFKTLVKDKTPVKLQARHFISKTKSSHRRCSLKKVFLKYSQKSQENTCVGVSFFIKLQTRSLQIYYKRLQHRCFPANFAKFLRTPFSENTFGRGLLQNLFVRLIPK